MAIRVLPTHLVNKIAAGEVIERPASIVKELVENALDAGAARIDVVIEDGGSKLIAVTDDGCGMDEGDMALAFIPHATSKLAREEDLFNIGTMGFRGEALASIASVSHAHIRSAPRDNAARGGHEIDASGETVGSPRPCAAAAGTTITIRDLFFNTPARRKFLKSANTEIGHISEQIARLSLPHPAVAFTLTHNGRSMQNLPRAASTAARAADLFGQDMAATLLPISPRGRAGVSVAGLIASPSAVRSSGKWQYFFVNGRYIRDRLLSHALREAYRGLIDPNRWPVGFIFIEIDPAEVDVNVHPTKIEVRFRDSQVVHGELLAALRETLNKANLTPDASLSGGPGPGSSLAGESLSGDDAVALDAQNLPPTSGGPEHSPESRRQSLRQAMADFFKSVPPTQPRLSFPDPPTGSSLGGDLPNSQARPQTSVFDLPQARAPEPSALAAERGAMAADVCRHAPHSAEDHPSSESAPSSQPREPAAGDLATLPALPAVALQVHNSYILTAAPDGLLIIDQHALHERLMYNDLKKRLAGGVLQGQRMLIPPTLRVTAAEADALAGMATLLASLGMEIVPFGPDTVAIQQFPTLLAQRGLDAQSFVRDLLDQLAEDPAPDSERLLEDVLAMMACKAAVKAGDPLTPAEIDDLLARRELAEKGSSCPHGRPITIKLTLKELEKQFKRT